MTPLKADEYSVLSLTVPTFLTVFKVFPYEAFYVRIYRKIVKTMQPVAKYFMPTFL